MIIDQKLSLGFFFLIKSTNCDLTKMGKIVFFFLFESNLYHLKEYRKRSKIPKATFRCDTYKPS